ncbi:MAG: DNA helicase II [Gammaproteobacteria bacterium]|nr:DNA helicase II [Gammaproteobacteria bacterium]MDH5304804.1 DNA helicase II [Gammaproteobacteria bacterium]MDH5322687.1 DNA helicase II [Gammaproteobacteria bacterium]
MDVTPILDSLNDAQRQAVTAAAAPTLVVAGAGSGKTRVLVHRAAWLIDVEGVSPQGLLAVTFTNKAAAEMRSRIEALLNIPVNQLWIGTFHGLAHRLLRRHWREANLPQNFQIIDSDDQLRLIKRLLKNLEIDDSRWEPRDIQYFINGQKDEGLRPRHLNDEGDPNRRQMIALYQGYEEVCERGGLVDFAELLLRAHELWRDNEELLAYYQRRFSHLLVDEFQDTNAIQYAWLRLLAGKTGIPFVVGDDDQSIYRWRGARVEHIHRFQKDFPGTSVVKLEQNYRSTATILHAANSVIENNSSRLGKKLWTDGADGEPIRVYAAYNERDESDFIIGRLRDWIEQGNLRADAAVLYRSNAQSRVLEEGLINAGIPYRVYGGLRFFERTEIKDALAYLRLISNRNDDSSFERVLNKPTRGIGARSAQMIRSYARANACSLWRAAGALASDECGGRTANSVHAFLLLIEALARDTNGLDLAATIDHVIHASGLVEFFKKDKGEKSETRIENLLELISAGGSFEPDPAAEMSTLDEFLSHAALEAGEGQADAWDDCVQLMTMHSAKGLEFPLVFLSGMEDGLFPHQRSISDPKGLEEERRLCYVGITRAMRTLYISYAEQRRLHGMESFSQPSRFVAEIPDQYIEEIRPRVQISRPLRSPGPGRSGVRQGAEIGIRLGQRVHHRKFGDGVILNCEGQGAHARVQVNFEDAGTKWLVLSYANLDLM